MKLQDKLFLSSIITLTSVGYGIYQYFKNNLIIEVKRLQYEQYFTYGKMYLNGNFFCDTLEDTYRGDTLEDVKIYGQTAIPKGKYKTIVSYSPKFNKYLPELLNVPYYTNIRIHAGSSINHTDGCILVGYTVNNEFVSNSNYTNTLVEKIKQYPNCYTIIK